MFTAILFCNEYDLLIDFNPYWEALYVNLLIYSSTVTTLIYLHSQWLINAHLFEFTI